MEQDLIDLIYIFAIILAGLGSLLITIAILLNKW